MDRGNEWNRQRITRTARRSQCAFELARLPLSVCQVSRSFAVVIQQLPQELQDPVCIFYLVLRGLDSVEDDMVSHSHSVLHASEPAVPLATLGSLLTFPPCFRFSTPDLRCVEEDSFVTDFP